MHRIPALATLVTFSTLAACASQSPDAPTSSPLSASASALDTETTGTSALAILKQGGTFMFSLDESDPAARMHDKCAAESGGEKAKADACYDAIREEGSTEGMRFAPDGNRVMWTSFGREDGKEIVYTAAPLSLAADGDHAVIASFVEAPRGPQPGNMNWASAKIRIELPDTTTMIMKDPSKGRLVFHKRGQ